MARQMRLTPDHVALVPPHDGAPVVLPEGREFATEDDHLAATAAILEGRPEDGDVWVFAYGSLIWNPDFDFIEERLALAPGWHRSFCLGWIRLYRGCPERPGIMLALDAGGSCRGVALRLPPGQVEDNLLKIIRREQPLRGSYIPARWVSVRTAQGRLRAIAFAIDRQSDAYLRGLTQDEVVHALATAAGNRGSMAEYLYSTVRHLEDRGIRDSYLWRLQELVARRIEDLSPDAGWPEALPGAAVPRRPDFAADLDLA